MIDWIALEGAGSTLRVQPRSLEVIEDDGERQVHAHGDLAAALLSDALGRLGSAGAVLDALGRLDPDPPAVLEALPRVTRVLLPASRRVVEVRVGRDRALQVRVEDPDASRRALDSRLRAATRGEVLELLSPAVALPGGALGLRGRLAVRWTTEGAALDDGIAPLQAWLADRDVPAIDDALLDHVALLGRRERFARGAPAEVVWRLIDLGLDVAWRPTGVTVAPCA